MLPASNAFSAVAPSAMICIWIWFSFTVLARRHLGFLTRSSDASCFHDASLNGPLPTKFAASVNLLPNLSTVGLYTGRNDVCDSCWMNQGCGEVSVICSLYLPTALIPTAAFSALQLALVGSQELYASAPLIPKNWYA